MELRAFRAMGCCRFWEARSISSGVEESVLWALGMKEFSVSLSLSHSLTPSLCLSL